MAVRIRIGTKIFALALCLLALTVALSLFGTIQSGRLQRELVQEASRDLPLEEVVMRLDQTGLRRRIEFERWTTLLDQAKPDPGALKKVAGAYKRYDDLLAKDAQAAKELIANAPTAGADRADLTRVGILVDQIQRDQAMAASLQQRILQNLSLIHI